jgi:glucose repression regulatory protein TUP1
VFIQGLPWCVLLLTHQINPVSSQVNELNIIRQSLYDLEAQHGKVRQHYEEELSRLRSELSSRQGLPSAGIPHTTVGPGSTGPPGISGPPAAVPGLLGGPSSYNDNYYARDREQRDRDRDERDRDRQTRDRDRGPDRDIRVERERAIGDRDRSDRERDRPVDQRDNKRLKTERIKTDRPGSVIFFFHVGLLNHPRFLDHFSPSLGPGPPIPKLPATSSTPSVGPGLPPQPPPHAGYGSAGPSSAISTSPADPPSSSSATLVPINTGSSGGFPDDLDPHNVPPELKKEGSDWFAAFNPKVKRVLDVNLVHTLMHERCFVNLMLFRIHAKRILSYSSVVCCVRFSSDGKFLATGCNRTAQIYDTKTGVKTWCVHAFFFYNSAANVVVVYWSTTQLGKRAISISVACALVLMASFLLLALRISKFEYVLLFTNRLFYSNGYRFGKSRQSAFEEFLMATSRKSIHWTFPSTVG